MRVPAASSLRWLLLIPMVALVTGAAGALFLHLLDLATAAFAAQPLLIWSLPAIGCLTAWAYAGFAKDSAGGVPALLEAIRQPRAALPAGQGPMILASTVLSHLGGASVGREGTALLMGGSLADQFSRILTLDTRERRTLLLCGVAAGFAAVFGTPWAGAIFALEFIRSRDAVALLACVPTALLADIAARQLFAARHSDYATPFAPLPLELSNLAGVIAVGLACGLVARGYLMAHRRGTALAARISSPLARAATGGALFACIITLTDAGNLTGLGLPVLASAFAETPAPWLWAAKAGATLLCLCFGFKGGEVTPLFVIGATLGAAMAPAVGLPLAVGAGAGFVSVFAGAGGVPLACAVMAGEIFTPGMGLLCLPAALLSRGVAGDRGLYADAP